MVPGDAFLTEGVEPEAVAVRRLGAALLLALFLLGATVGAGFFIVTLFIHDMDVLMVQSDIATEQRILTQRIARLAFLLDDSNDVGVRYALRQQLQQAVVRVEQRSDDLRVRKDALWIYSSPLVPRSFRKFILQQDAYSDVIRGFSNEVHGFLLVHTREDESGLEIAQGDHRSLIAQWLDGPVLRAQEDFSESFRAASRSHMRLLRVAHLSVFGATMIILVVVAVVVLRPLMIRAETALFQVKGDRDRLEAILHSIDDAVIEISPQGRVIFANQAAAQCLRLPDGLTDVLTLAHLLGNGGSDGQSLLRAARLGESFQCQQVVLTRLDHSCFQAVAVLSPLQERTGLVRGLGAAAATTLSASKCSIVTFRDVTEHLRREERLRKLSHAVEFSPAPVVITDDEGIIEYVNPAFSAISGWSEAEVLGQSPSLIRSGRQQTEFYRTLWETLRRGDNWRGEFHNRRKDGQDYWVRASIAPVRDDNGVITHFVAVQEDVTQEKTALVELESSRRRLREAIESLPHGFAIFNPDETLSMCNAAFRSLFHLALRSEPENVSFGDMVRHGIQEGLYRNGPEGNAEAYVQNRLELFRRGGELELSLSDGRYVLATDSVTPSGDHVSLRADITDVKRIQEELEAARVVADRANKAKSYFLSSMSHELRTPLNAILGFAQVLSMGRQNPLIERQRDQVAQITTAGQHLLSLIDEILDLAKIESGRFSLSPSLVIVGDVVDECLGLMETLAQEKGVAVSVETVPSVCVWADYMRLKQVVINLLSNAIKYNVPDGQVIIQCEVISEAESLRFVVEDSGIGVPAERRQEIFQPFSRLGREASVTPGTGIGLSLAHQLVAMMGGSLELEKSERLGGTRFFFSLPLSSSSALGGGAEGKLTT